MQRRQLMVLYIALSVIAVLLAWRLGSEWKRANLRYAAPHRTTAAAPAYLPPSSAPHAAPPLLSEIVAKNLFSPDRNNDVIQDEKPQPAPPAPIVFGTINLGGSFEALMAERGQSARPGFRRVKNGEQLGGYTIVEIRDEKVVVEFRGQKTTLNVYESANSVPRANTRTNLATGPVVESVGAPPPQAAAPAPAQSSSGGPSSPAASAPPAPASGITVTVEGNRRRMERSTPFGLQVWYEEIPKQ